MITKTTSMNDGKTQYASNRLSPRNGSVLFVTMVIVGLLAMVAVSLLYLVSARTKAATVGANAQQARAAAYSGIVSAMYAAADALNGETETTLDDLMDNPDRFKAQPLFQDGAVTWYFTIYAPSTQDSTTVRYGLEDESGKLNINIASLDSLAALPGMDAEKAAAIVDWRDSDEETQPNGAESDYYQALKPPYASKNGPLLTVEELLLVRGMTADIVYGEDANLNGRLDAAETDNEETNPPDDGDDQLNRGLRGLVTPLSWEPNLNSNGKARIDLNGDLDGLENTGLSRDTVNFIKAVCADGLTITHPVQFLNFKWVFQTDQSQFLGNDGKKGKTATCELADGDLAILLDCTTCNNSATIGLINVNTAPAEVLTCLPGLDANTAGQIVSGRADLSAEEKATPAWLFTQEILDADDFMKVAPRLTARSFQFRVRSVGYSTSGQFCVLEALVDLGEKTPRIRYLRDLTRFGLPLPVADIIGEEE